MPRRAHRRTARRHAATHLPLLRGRGIAAPARGNRQRAEDLRGQAEIINTAMTIKVGLPLLSGRLQLKLRPRPVHGVPGRRSTARAPATAAHRIDNLFRSLPGAWGSVILGALSGDGLATSRGWRSYGRRAHSRRYGRNLRFGAGRGWPRRSGCSALRRAAGCRGTGQRSRGRRTCRRAIPAPPRPRRGSSHAPQTDASRNDRSAAPRPLSAATTIVRPRQAEHKRTDATEDTPRTAHLLPSEKAHSQDAEYQCPGD